MLEIRWRCRAGCTLTPRPPQELELAVEGRDPVLIPLRSTAAQHLARLNRGVAEVALAAAAGADYALSALLLRFMHRLRAGGLLVADLYGDGVTEIAAGARAPVPTPAAAETVEMVAGTVRRLATVRPLTADFALPDCPVPSREGARRRHLSRFALLRRAGRQWLLEGTDADCEVLIDDPAVIDWLHQAATAPPPLPSLAFQVLELLAGLGFLDDAGATEPAERRTWEFHDRLFHARSRCFGRLRPFGDTYRFRERPADAAGAAPAQPPALRAPYPGASLALPVPDVAASRPLAEVMEGRRSHRSMGDPPVSLAQVAALLYRVARVTHRLPDDYVLRPYPSAGALHELEFYLAVHTCRGLPPGFYHYRSDAHVLTHLAGAAATRAAAALVTDCAQAWGRPEQPPQCLMVVSARVPRMAWKYEAIAYRLSLLGAGVVVQSLYLVATDLGLNGCAAGTGNPALFAQATGVSPWTETSIAEFGFGSAAG